MYASHQLCEAATPQNNANKNVDIIYFNKVPPPSPAASDSPRKCIQSQGTSPPNVHSSNCAKTVSRKHAKKKIKAIRASVSEGNELIVKGEHQSIEEVNKTKEAKAVVETDANNVRLARKEISAIVSEMKQAPEIDYKKIKPELSKDTFNFIRGHLTMTLSTLKSLEKSFLSSKRANDTAVKADTVAQVQYQRDVRREKILQHQQMIKEMVMNWRLAKNAHVKNELEKIDRNEEEKHLKVMNNVKTAMKASQKLKEKQNFCKKFIQAHCKLEKALKEERVKYSIFEIAHNIIN